MVCLHFHVSSWPFIVYSSTLPPSLPPSLLSSLPSGVHSDTTVGGSEPRRAGIQRDNRHCNRGGVSHGLSALSGCTALRPWSQKHIQTPLFLSLPPCPPPSLPPFSGSCVPCGFIDVLSGGQSCFKGVCRAVFMTYHLGLISKDTPF